MTQQAIRLPECPVVRLSEKLPRPRSSLSSCTWNKIENKETILWRLTVAVQLYVERLVFDQNKTNNTFISTLNIREHSHNVQAPTISIKCAERGFAFSPTLHIFEIHCSNVTCFRKCRIRRPKLCLKLSELHPIKLNLSGHRSSASFSVGLLRILKL